MANQVPAQESQFGLDGPLVAAQERLVVPPGQPDRLTPGSAARRADAGLGQRGLVLVADQDQFSQSGGTGRRSAAGPVS
jgi:hypothetical protein